MDEAAFRDVISGNRPGLAAAAQRRVLSGLSVGYRLGVSLRNRMFDTGLRAVHAIDVPVVSVGNITTGGTGKTPFVAFIANQLRQRGRTVVLLSRGYGAEPGQPNDEKRVLDQLCPGIPHLQDPDRVATAARAVTEFRADAIVLDDGFQHRRLGRELDIVLIDGTNPWGYGHLLPRGLLREPLSGLKRAGLVVITRADECSESQLREIRDVVARERGAGVHATISFPPTGLVNATGRRIVFADLPAGLHHAFCGIGNPTGFTKTLTRAGIHIDAMTTFPDHHHYCDADLTALATNAQVTSAVALLTTLKDLVKIRRDHIGECPLWAVEIGVDLLTGGEVVEHALERIAQH